MFRGPRLLFLILLSVWGLCAWWFTPAGGALTAAEIDAYIEQIRARVDGPVDPGLIAELRTLAASDDGRAFVNVNLIRFRDKAAYPPGSGYGDDPLEADRRYSEAIIPALFRHGAMPLWVGNVSGRFLEPTGAEHWDRAALVRYRSRRDLFEMVVELAGQPIGIHKWASIKKTHVFPAVTTLSVASPPLIAGALLTWLGLLLHLVLRRFAFYTTT